MTVRVGDKVRIVAEHGGHGFEVGEVVMLTETHEGSFDFRADDLDGSDYWYVYKDEIEPIDAISATAPISTLCREKMEDHMGKGEYVRAVKWAQLAEQAEALENE